jgi:hypothetical protein
MQIQSQSTREAIAVNPIPFRVSFEVQVEATHLRRDGAALKVARRTVQSSQLSLSESYPHLAAQNFACLERPSCAQNDLEEFAI